MRVTVITEDQTILLDGVPLSFPFYAEQNIHAIQWHDDHGVIEQQIGGAITCDLATVQPFIDAYRTEAARLAAEAEAARLDAL